MDTENYVTVFVFKIQRIKKCWVQLVSKLRIMNCDSFDIPESGYSK